MCHGKPWVVTLHPSLEPQFGEGALPVFVVFLVLPCHQHLVHFIPSTIHGACLQVGAVKLHFCLEGRSIDFKELRDELVVLSVRCDLLYILHDLLGCLAISGNTNLLIVRDINVWIRNQVLEFLRIRTGIHSETSDSSNEELVRVGRVHYNNRGNRYVGWHTKDMTSGTAVTYFSELDATQATFADRADSLLIVLIVLIGDGLG